MSHVRAYFRKAGYACGMNKKGHILVNLGQFEDETPLTICKFKVLGVRKYKKFKNGIAFGYRTQLMSKRSPACTCAEKFIRIC